MRKLAGLAVTLGLILSVLVVGPVSAGSRQDVTMTVTTIFDEFPDAFTATGIPDCEWGSVYDVGAHVEFTPRLGVFAGYKAFDCEDGGENGFVVRLNARFGPDGSVGAWAVVEAWGSLAGITDNYFGAVIF